MMMTYLGGGNSGGGTPGQKVPQPPPPVAGTGGNPRTHRLKRSPWLVSSSKLSVDSNSPKKDPLPTAAPSKHVTSITRVLPARTGLTNIVERVPPERPTQTQSHGGDRLPALSKDSKQGSRFSDPALVASRRRGNQTGGGAGGRATAGKQSYMPRLTKYRLEHPDRFLQLASKPARHEATRQGETPAGTADKAATGQGGPCPQQQEQKKQQAMRESRLLTMATHTQPGNSRSKSPVKATTDQSGSGGGGVNLTLLDIAKLTQPAIDRSHASRISDLLWNTYIDVQRFRKLLRDDDNKVKTEREKAAERVSILGEEKTARITAWLARVEDTRAQEGLETTTVMEDIRDEDTDAKKS